MENMILNLISRNVPGTACLLLFAVKNISLNVSVVYIRYVMITYGRNVSY